MADEPEAGPPTQPDLDAGEDGGGPIKTFLEHLEDLRWTLVKTLSAVLIAMLVCLIAGNYLVALLMWPLQNAQWFMQPKTQQVPVMLGTNFLGKVMLNDFGRSLWDTNTAHVLRLVPVQVGTNRILALEAGVDRVETDPPMLVSIKNYSPIEGILVAMKLALYGGLVISSPFVFFFIGQFVLPALKVKEKYLLFRAVGVGSILFFIGVAFCYFIVAVVALGATVQFSQWLGFGADEWRADAYISFMCKFMIGMGLCFELPVIILTLVKIGLLDYAKLKGFRSYAIVGNLVIAAVVTPSGDPFSMLVMALPLHFLYEVSTFIAWWWERKARKLKAAAPDADAGSI